MANTANFSTPRLGEDNSANMFPAASAQTTAQSTQPAPQKPVKPAEATHSTPRPA